jgi:serine/threonine protein kinase
MNGQLLDGRYEIVQVLGKGGFGKTFLSKDIKRPGHPECVVKQLSYFSENYLALETARRLFKKEAETLEKLGQHPQIPRLLAEFEENQEFYLVQELIDGYTLNKEFVPGENWAEDKVINFLKDVLQILVFVHEQGVIHRDIKPANLMRRANDGKLVLIDFGSVKEIVSQTPHAESTPTVVIGTPAYMPMEQFHGFPQLNSDIYALGMIAIQALLGLRTDELTKLPRSHNQSHDHVIWPSRPLVSQSLGFVINQMVRLDRHERYQTASEVLRDLTKYTCGFESDFPLPAPPKFKPPMRAGGIIGLIVLLLSGFTLYNQPPQVNARSDYNLGLEKLKLQEQHGAIKKFTQAIRLNPNYAERQLKSAQRKVSRRHMGSNRRQKANTKLNPARPISRGLRKRAN